MDTLIQLTAALLVTSGLALLSRHWGYTRGYQHGLEDGRKETAQLSYHQGHEEGLYEGRLKERMEIATSGRKQYEQGYNDALAAVAGMNYTAMLDEAETQLSA